MFCFVGIGMDKYQDVPRSTEVRLFTLNRDRDQIDSLGQIHGLNQSHLGSVLMSVSLRNSLNQYGYQPRRNNHSAISEYIGVEKMKDPRYLKLPHKKISFNGWIENKGEI